MHKELEALGGVETPATSNFWSWVKKTFTLSYQQEIDAYFRDCVDIHDVERVMTQLQRRGML